MRDTTGGLDWHLQEVWAFIDALKQFCRMSINDFD